MGSEKLFRKDCTRVQFPIWLRGSVHISVHVLRRVAAGISSSLCIKRHSFGQFHSLTYINRWCWLLHKVTFRYIIILPNLTIQQTIIFISFNIVTKLFGVWVVNYEVMALQKWDKCIRDYFLHSKFVMWEHE